MDEVAKYEREQELLRELLSALEPHIEANPDSTITATRTRIGCTGRLRLKEGLDAVIMVWIDPKSKEPW